MKTFLLGALIGLVAGIVITLAVVDRDSAEKTATSPEDVSIQKADRARKNLGNSVANDITKKYDVSSKPTNSPASIDSPKSDATNLPAPARAPVSPKSQNVNAPFANPIPITDAHRQLLDTSTRIENGQTLAQRHDALEAEDLDTAWSYYMEEQLSRFFAIHAPPLHVDIANITCRATACEIQAFMDGESQAILGLIKAAAKEPWWDFSGASSNSDDYQGRERALVFLQRKNSSNQVQQHQKVEKDLATRITATG